MIACIDSRWLVTFNPITKYILRGRVNNLSERRRSSLRATFQQKNRQISPPMMFYGALLLELQKAVDATFIVDIT